VLTPESHDQRAAPAAHVEDPHALAQIQALDQAALDQALARDQPCEQLGADGVTRGVVTMVVMSVTVRHCQDSRDGTSICSDISYMRSSRRFSVALHVLVHLSARGREAVTSERLAECVGTNAVVVRRTLAWLREAGLISSSVGEVFDPWRGLEARLVHGGASRDVLPCGLSRASRA
jgi:hypothetical protein